MANKLILIGFLLAMFAYTYTDGANIQYSNEISPASDTDIEVIKKSINDISEKVMIELKDAYEHVSSLVETILSTGYDLNSILAIQHDNEIRRENGIFEVDLSECFQKHDDQINDIITKKSEELHKCTGDVMAELNGIYDKTLAAIQEAIDDIFGTIEKLKACTTDECFSEIGQQINNEYNELSKHIANALSEGLDAIWKVLPDAAKCSIEVLSPYKEVIKKIVSDIKTCIKEKLD